VCRIKNYYRNFGTRALLVKSVGGLDHIFTTEPNVFQLIIVCLDVFLYYQVCGSSAFLVYINDLPSAISLSKIFIFADDA